MENRINTPRFHCRLKPDSSHLHIKSNGSGENKMCKYHNKQNMDKCMKQLVKFINQETRFQTMMCCCGHGKYPPSLIVIDSRVAQFCNTPQDIFSGFQFKHGRRKFYKKDKQGYYYIPELNTQNY